MAQGFIDRRRHGRMPVDVPVRVSTIEPERDPRTGRTYFRASRERSGNLSRGGVFVRTSDLLSPGRRVLLEVELPGHPGFEAVGRVAWCRCDPKAPVDPEVGIGIEFLGSSPDQAGRLEHFLDALPARRET